MDWDSGFGFKDLNRGLGLWTRLEDWNWDGGTKLEIEIGDWKLGLET